MAKKDFEGADFDEFFGSKGLKVEDYEHRRRSFGGVIGALAGILVLSVIAGAFVAIPGFVWGSAAVQVAAPYAEFWKKLPEKLPEITIGERNKIVDKNGKVFAEIWTEDRIALDSLDDVAPFARDGLIDTEDKRFYEHGGFDIRGTVRAAVSSGGGSGITQQLIKNLQFYNLAGKDKKQEATEDSYNRKLRELKYAMAYERDHTKNEILLKYFNTVAFGAPNIYSIESAANYFFGKSAKDLTLGEAAALVGSVKNPSLYNLDSTDPKKIDAWKERQHIVLDRMVDQKTITAKQAQEAKAQELKIVRKGDGRGTCASSQYTYYCDYVMDYLMHSPRFGETEEERAAIIARGGLTIKTYMDPAAIDTMNAQLSSSFGNENRLIAPTAIVQPGTGGVIAMAQNRTYGGGPGQTNINLADTPAATGSAYKMVTLAAAFENMPESALSFGSQCPLRPGPGFDSPQGGFRNADGCGKDAGVLDYKSATAYSSNTWFVTLAMKVGMDKVLDMSKRMNLRTDGLSDRSLSAVLGSKENTPIDMAAAYATFSNEGIFCPATPIESYEYQDGTSPAVPDTYNPAQDACRSVMSPSSASGVLRALRANTYGEVPGALGTTGRIDGYDAVGKTGTNERYNVTWAQVSSNYAIFIDIYDMTALTRGFMGGYWRGGSLSSSHDASIEASQMLSKVVGIENPERKGLDYSNTSKKPIDVPVDNREFFTVPELSGMDPAQALATARSLGIKAEVSKETRPTPEYFEAGSVVEQSLTAGTQLPIGTKKELILYLGK